jgi:hypothetical protein
VLRKAFGSKREDVIEKWRKLRNKELHSLYFLSNILGVSSQEVGERVILQALEGIDIQIEFGGKV